MEEKGSLDYGCRSENGRTVCEQVFELGHVSTFNKRNEEVIATSSLEFLTESQRKIIRKSFLSFPSIIYKKGREK